MISINDRIKQIYLDLFQDDPVYVTLGLSFLQDDLQRVKDKSSVLCFSDWAQLSEITTYDDSWIEEFQFDLTKRAFEFGLNCAEVLLMIGGYKTDTDRFLTLVNTAIENNSLESIDVLIGFLIHPEAELYLGGPNLLSQSFLKGRKIVVDHLLTKYNMNPDGLKTINAMGTYEDYSDVEFTIDLGSLGYIMTSPYLSYLEKIDMMSYAISKGASPLGLSSPEIDCFDPPIAIAASIHIVLLDYFISLGIAAEYSGLDLVYAAVSSKAPFIEKEKILDRLFEIYDIDVNQNSEEKGYSLIEYAVIRNGKDALETLEYLINKGSDYDADNLIQLAHTSRQYEMRDELFYKLGGSTSLYNDLIDEEKELMRKEDESRLSGKPRIWVVFPEKEY
jgi:hypothetical protein